MVRDVRTFVEPLASLLKGFLRWNASKTAPPLNVRALLEPTGTPFAVADYGPRAVIFTQATRATA